LVEAIAAHPVIGAIQICDDWGFKTDTFLSPETLRRAIFPWHQRVVAAAHAAEKIAILHACGNVFNVMDDVIGVMGYDAKHSFEDVICPVEEAWRRYSDRITILGGLDVDFLARSTPAQIYDRCRALVESAGKRRYALGSGNSVTPDVSWENYMAMLRAAWDFVF
jgi:uroporphyrinogen decarboxylase